MFIKKKINKMLLNYEEKYILKQLCCICEYNNVKYESYIGNRVCEECVEPIELEDGDYVEVFKNDPSKFRGYIYKFMYDPCKNNEKIVEDIFYRIIINLNDKYINTDNYELDSVIPEELLENDYLKEIIIDEMNLYDMELEHEIDYKKKFIRTLSPKYFINKDYDIDDLLDYIQVNNDIVRQVLYYDYKNVNLDTGSLYCYINHISEEYYLYMDNLEHFYENTLKCHIEDCSYCYKKKFPQLII
jgi:hypothetical protein